MLCSQAFPNISNVNMKTLPRIGYIAMLGKSPVAAGFLRRVEGGYAQLDGLCSNAYLGSLVRNEGITMVVAALIQESKDLKLHGIIAFTRDDSVLKRAAALGFQIQTDTLIILPRT
jgi:hypothetical protein